MRIFPGAAGLLAVLVSASCVAHPTEEDILDTLETTLRSVAGSWTGVSGEPNVISLEFRLQEGSNGGVSGTGTMKEESAPSAVPITVSGTFRRPTLSLTFSGMVYEGQQVQGTATGDYTTVGGISATLQLTGPDYSRAVPILLQEK